MNNLERLDAAIVEAAEAAIAAWRNPGNTVARADANNNLERVVQAKREATRPQCMVPNCDQVAVQRVIDDAEASEYFRCVQHQIATRDL